MKGAVVLLLCAACGRLAFDARGDAGDGDGAANGDSALDAAPTCMNWGPFSAPMHSTELASTQNEYATAVAEDNLYLVFDSDRSGGVSAYDLWQTSRASRAVAYDPPTPLNYLNTSADDSNPAISPDGNTLYISSDPTGPGKIYVATRSDRTQQFGTPVMLQGPVNQPFSVCCPSVSPDERTIYLSVDATGTGLDYEIYEATRPDRTNDFGTPTRIAALSSSSNDWTPSISSDGLELYFQTNRGVNYDIYVSRRASTTDAWPTPARLEPLSGDTYSETDPTISYDGTSLGFGMFQGPGGLGNADIYYASRSCLDP